MVNRRSKVSLFLVMINPPGQIHIVMNVIVCYLTYAIDCPLGYRDFTIGARRFRNEVKDTRRNRDSMIDKIL